MKRNLWGHLNLLIAVGLAVWAGWFASQGKPWWAVWYFVLAALNGGCYWFLWRRDV